MGLRRFLAGTGQGEMSSYTGLFAIATGREQSLRAHFDGLAASPLSRVAGTHFARFAVIAPEQFEHVRHPPEAPQLLFSSVFRGAQSAYLERLAEAIPDEAAAIWGHCDGYVDARTDRGGFVRFLRDGALAPLFRAAAYDAEAEDVVRALELRRGLRALAEDRGADERERFARLVR